MILTAIDPKVGDFYDPRLYPGYTDIKAMQLFQSKLVQLDIRDADDELILPWNWLVSLQPGALVMVHGKVKQWRTEATEKKKAAHVCFLTLQVQFCF